MRNRFTKIFALVAMSVMSIGMWAIDIPLNVGEHILIGTATGNSGFVSDITASDCKVDALHGDATNNRYYSIGSTESSATMSISLTAKEAGDYYFGFQSGASGCSSIITVSLTADGGAEPILSEEVTISDIGDWTPRVEHQFLITGIEAVDYTLSLSVKEIKSGSYAGNFGHFYFHKAEQLPQFTSSSYIPLADGTYTNAKYNFDNVINYIKRTGGSIDNLLMYNRADGYYCFHFNIDAKKQDGKVTITVTDYATDTQEAQEIVVITEAGNYHQPLSISKGVKKVRFDFADNDETADNDNLFNFRQVYFYNELPITGTTVLDMSKGSMTSSSDPRYASQGEGTNNEIQFIYNNGYAEFYINNPVTATYDLNTVTSNYSKGGTFKVTITDVATGTVEVDAQESDEITSDGQSISMRLNNQLSQGLKKIRFDFVNTSAGNNWLYNIKDVSFSFVNYTRVHPHKNLNTLCFPYKIDTYTGAKFYTIQETEVDGEGQLVRLVLEEHVGALSAGVPYFYDPDPSAGELVCNFSGSYTDVQAGAGGLTGLYPDNSPVPANKYVTVDNQLWKTGDNVTMGEYRAYVDPAGGAYRRAPIPGRARKTVGRYGAPSAVEDVQSGNVQSTKIIRNGQLIIIRDGVEYNAMGQVIK